MRKATASKIDNDAISLLWQLRCYCNLDHNKFPSLFNTAVAAIFFQISVDGNVIYAQSQEVLSLKKPIEPS